MSTPETRTLQYCHFVLKELKMAIPASIKTKDGVSMRDYFEVAATMPNLFLKGTNNRELFVHFHKMTKGKMIFDVIANDQYSKTETVELSSKTFFRSKDLSKTKAVKHIIEKLKWALEEQAKPIDWEDPKLHTGCESTSTPILKLCSVWRQVAYNPENPAFVGCIEYNPKTYDLNLIIRKNGGPVFMNKKFNATVADWRHFWQIMQHTVLFKEPLTDAIKFAQKEYKH